MIDIALQIQQKESPTNAHLENELTRDLLKKQRHPDFPYVIAVEWYHDPYCEQVGKGDVVFANKPFPSSHYQQLFRDEELKKSPLKVLIVEVKGIGSTGKRIKRRKVEEQIEKSMKAWRVMRPNDEIWGCIYSDEQKDWWSHLERYDELQSSRDRLCVELVPQGAWSKNFKPRMPVDLWHLLLERYKREANYSCEICDWSESSDTPAHQSRLILHQRWVTRGGSGQDAGDGSSSHRPHHRSVATTTTATTTGTLVFLDFEILCWDCHDCKHWGWASAEGRARQMIMHYSQVNGYDTGTAVSMIQLAAQKFHSDSSRATGWVVDTRRFDAIPEVVQWKQQHPEHTIKFGSLCMKRQPAYNNNPS